MAKTNEYQIEKIPDSDLLYRRFLLKALNSTINHIQSDIFEPSKKDNKVSTEWDKYSSIKQIKANAPKRKPEEYSVVEIKVGDIRNECNLGVKHAPEKNNQAHTNIKDFSEKKSAKLKAKRKLAQYARYSEPLIIKEKLKNSSIC